MCECELILFSPRPLSAYYFLLCMMGMKKKKITCAPVTYPCLFLAGAQQTLFFRLYVFKHIHRNPRIAWNTSVEPHHHPLLTFCCTLFFYSHSFFGPLTALNKYNIHSAAATNTQTQNIRTQQTCTFLYNFYVFLGI